MYDRSTTHLAQHWNRVNPDGGARLKVQGVSETDGSEASVELGWTTDGGIVLWRLGFSYSGFYADYEVSSPSVRP